MENVIVKVEHLSHRYSIQWAVRDVSFEILKGGIYGLLGSNGAGKSTTMNIMSGVIKQTEGDVYIKGIDTRKDPIEAKRLIGFLPQRPPLYGDFTVEEYLRHTAALRLMPEHMIKYAVDEVLRKCRIEHFRNRLIKNLSGGYQQRVGIAQAIVHKPELVIFDEPTNGLDPNQILDIRGLIRDIAQECTVILSTHILTEVQAVCDHILMIEEGKLVFCGSVEEFDNYITPNTLFVAFHEGPELKELQDYIHIQQIKELGHLKYRICFSEAQELINNLIDLSSKNRWQLTELRVEKSSMDNIFAELSAQLHKSVAI